MKKAKFTCAQARQLDLIDFLASLGYLPTKIRNQDYWYLSPFRNEKEASFKVNRRRNVWFDHGLGKGGDLINFGKLYYQCSVKELLGKLDNESTVPTYFHPQEASGSNKLSTYTSKIIITENREIADPVLRQYLHDRNIPLFIANHFCHETTFELYGKKRVAIGFKNNSGGFELRGPHFKGSSSPKTCTLMGGNTDAICVFEGFFNFLSFAAARLEKGISIPGLPTRHTSFLVLNGLSFFEKSREVMEKFDRIHLYLDPDPSGLACSKMALGWSGKYIDQSTLYEGYKDLNDYWITLREQSIQLSRTFKKDAY